VSSRLIAASIFGGCVVIALALYLALRPHPPAARAPRDPVPRAPVTVASQAVKDRVSADVQAALRARIPHWIETCWNPAIAANPAPASSKHVFDVTVDAAGTEVARGISEVRDAPSRDDVGTCLRADHELIHIPAPRVQVRVSVWVRLPN
jgi:hypothetical protein